MGYFGMSRFFLVISPNSGSFHYTEFLSFKVNSVYHWIILAYFTTTWSTIKEYSERAKIAALNCWRTCSHKTGEGQGPHTLRPKMDISVQAVLSLFIFLSLSSSWEDDEAKLFPLQPETQHELFLYQAEQPSRIWCVHGVCTAHTQTPMVSTASSQKCHQSQTAEKFRTLGVIYPRAVSIFSSEHTLLI